jgi:hypothetical protein
MEQLFCFYTSPKTAPPNERGFKELSVAYPALLEAEDDR